jgi:hypothetical protein
MIELLRFFEGAETPSKITSWSVGHLGPYGMLLACDGFSIKFDVDQLNLFFDYLEDGKSGEIRDHDGHVVLVEPTNSSVILTRNGDKLFPAGIEVDEKTLKLLGVELHDFESDQEDATDLDNDKIDSETNEGIKRAFRKSGGKIKRGFRVTSGFRKGRVVSSAAGAFKPRAKASTRTKLKLAARKKKIVRVLKAKRTKRKPMSKRLHRLNSK